MCVKLGCLYTSHRVPLESDRTGSSKRKAETGTVPHNTQSQGGTLSSSRVLKLYFLPRHYEDILFS